jgi:hypothetical protein
MIGTQPEREVGVGGGGCPGGKWGCGYKNNYPRIIAFGMSRGLQKLLLYQYAVNVHPLIYTLHHCLRYPQFIVLIVN